MLVAFTFEGTVTDQDSRYLEVNQLYANKNVVLLMQSLNYAGHDIEIWSGITEDSLRFREASYWLDKNGVPYSRLRGRPASDDPREMKGSEEVYADFIRADPGGAPDLVFTNRLVETLELRDLGIQVFALQDNG